MPTSFVISLTLGERRGIDALVALAGTGEASMSRQAHRAVTSFENISNQARSGEIASLLRAVVHER